MTGVKNMKWLDSQVLPMRHDNASMHRQIRQIRNINDDIKQIGKAIRGLAFQNEDARRILSMTGFDSYGALLLALEIDGIGRFPTPKKLVSWMGMCPTVHQSGNDTPRKDEE